MNEDDYGRLLEGAHGDLPEAAFVAQLERDLDMALHAREANERRRSNGHEFFHDRLGGSDLPAVSHDPRTWTAEDARRSALVRRAAAFIVLVGLLGGLLVALNRRDGNVETTTPTELAAQLLAAADDPSISEGERLGLLAEAFRVGGTDEATAMLGAELFRRDELIRFRREGPNPLASQLSSDLSKVLYTDEGASYLWDLVDDAVSTLSTAGLRSEYEIFTAGDHIFAGGAADEPVVDVESLEPVEGGVAVTELPRGLFAVGPMRHQQLQLYDIDAKRVVATTRVNWEPKGVRGSPDGSLIFVGQPPSLANPDYHVVVWETRTGALLDDHPLLSQSPTSVRQVSFAPDVPLVAIAASSEVEIRSSVTFEVLRTFDTGARVLDVSFTGTGGSLAVTAGSGSDVTVGLWNAETAGPLLSPFAIGAHQDDFVAELVRRPTWPVAGHVVYRSVDRRGIDVWAIDPGEWLAIACFLDELKLPRGATACAGITTPR